MLKNPKLLLLKMQPSHLSLHNLSQLSIFYRRTTTLRQVAQLLSTAPISTPLPAGASTNPAFQSLTSVTPLTPHAFRTVYYDAPRKTWTGKEVGRGVTRVSREEVEDLMKDNDEKKKDQDEERMDLDEDSSKDPSSSNPDSRRRNQSSTRNPAWRVKNNDNEYDEKSSRTTLGELNIRDGDCLDCVVLLPQISPLAPSGPGRFSVRGTASNLPLPIGGNDFTGIPKGPSANLPRNEPHPWGETKEREALGHRDRPDRGRGGFGSGSSRGGRGGMDSGWGIRGRGAPRGARVDREREERSNGRDRFGNDRDGDRNGNERIRGTARDGEESNDSKMRDRERSPSQSRRRNRSRSSSRSRSKERSRSRD